MQIRKASIDDSEQLFILAKDFSTSFKPEKMAFEKSLTELLKDNSAYLIVAVIENKIIGYCLAFDHYTLFANGRVSWVEEIMVQEKHRKNAVGKALMADVEEWAGNRKSKLVALATRRAAAFYKAIGYEESAAYFRKLIDDRVKS
jgi:GNAT superfamily N-acetyltransferase